MLSLVLNHEPDERERVRAERELARLRERKDRRRAQLVLDELGSEHARGQVLRGIA